MAATLMVSVTGATVGQPPSTFASLDRIPESTLREMKDTTKSVGFPGLAWPVPIVKVAFAGGDPKAYALIEAAASEWTSLHGSLAFSFRRPDGTWRTWSGSDGALVADIRVGFATDAQHGGYWSVVGTLARRVPGGQATMNLGDLGTGLAKFYGGKNHAEWLASYSHEVVLHEFGHALGLAHEHFHPQCQADLNLEKIITYLMGPPNGWSREQAAFNMDAKTYFDAVNKDNGTVPVSMSTGIDQASVMLYSFQDAFYKSGSRSPCRPSGSLHYATTLSPLDRQYYLRNYPTRTRQ